MNFRAGKGLSGRKREKERDTEATEDEVGRSYNGSCWDVFNISWDSSNLH